MGGHKLWSEISLKVQANPESRVRIEQREQAVEAYLERYYRRWKTGKGPEFMSSLWMRLWRRQV